MRSEPLDDTDPIGPLADEVEAGRGPVALVQTSFDIDPDELAEDFNAVPLSDVIVVGIGERCHVEDDTLVQRLNRGLMPGWYW